MSNNLHPIFTGIFKAHYRGLDWHRDDVELPVDEPEREPAETRFERELTKADQREDWAWEDETR